jgi:hypothetical protein
MNQYARGPRKGINRGKGSDLEGVEESGAVVSIDQRLLTSFAFVTPAAFA